MTSNLRKVPRWKLIRVYCRSCPWRGYRRLTTRTGWRSCPKCGGEVRS